jgi:PAS domain S-box-containing protein
MRARDKLRPVEIEIPSLGERRFDPSEVMHDAVIQRDLRGQVLDWNPGAERLYGWRRAEAIGRHVQEILHCRFAREPGLIRNELIALGHWHGEVNRTTGDGRELVVDMRCTLLRDADDRPAEIIETSWDVTERNRAAEARLVHDHRYRNMFHAMVASFWELDFSLVRVMIGDVMRAGPRDMRAFLMNSPDFIDKAMRSTFVVDVNAKTLALFGAKDRADMLGRDVRAFWPKQSEHIYAESLLAAIERRPHLVSEAQFLTLDGQTIDTLFTVSWPTGNEGQGTVLVAVVDLTEQVAQRRAMRRMEDELAHAARVAVLGELAASIAHEVNQPLAAIATNGEAGLRWLDRPVPEIDEVRALTGRIVADARRASDIIARIKAMSAKRAPERATIDINELVREALLFVRHEQQAHQIDTRLDLADGLPPISADRTQLQQVIVNLAVNAIQAMTGHATTGDGPADRRLDVTTRHDGRSIVIEIADNGPGIAADHVDRLFESFFTTKATGVGLGLPICRSIVEAHGGAIEAENRAEGGAVFRIGLPVIVARAEAGAAQL